MNNVRLQSSEKQVDVPFTQTEGFLNFLQEYRGLGSIFVTVAATDITYKLDVKHISRYTLCLDLPSGLFKFSNQTTTQTLRLSCACPRLLYYPNTQKLISHAPSHAIFSISRHL